MVDVSSGRSSVNYPNNPPAGAGGYDAYSAYPPNRIPLPAKYDYAAPLRQASIMPGYRSTEASTLPIASRLLHTMDDPFAERLAPYTPEPVTDQNRATLAAARAKNPSGWETFERTNKLISDVLGEGSVEAFALPGSGVNLPPDKRVSSNVEYRDIDRPSYIGTVFPGGSKGLRSDQFQTNANLVDRPMMPTSRIYWADRTKDDTAAAIGGRYATPLDYARHLMGLR